MIRFALIGGVCTGIQYLLLGLLHGRFDWPAVWASACGYLVSAICSYLLNYRFSFEPNRSLTQGAWRYALIVAAGLAFNSMVLSGLLALGMAVLPAQIIATGVVFVLNYQLSRRWAFSATTPPANEPRLAPQSLSAS